MKRDATVKAVDAGQRLSLRDEQKNLTRRRVLDAAVAVFAEKSFIDATMEDIARAAGCPFDPAPAMRARQQEGALTRVRLWDGSTPWLVTGHA